MRGDDGEFSLPMWGRWGGPGYSAGGRNTTGARSDVGAYLTDQAADRLDHLFKRHDARYELEADNAAGQMAADQEFLEEFRRARPLMGLRERLAGDLAAKAFEAKLSAALSAGPAAGGYTEAPARPTEELETVRRWLETDPGVTRDTSEGLGFLRAQGLEGIGRFAEGIGRATGSSALETAGRTAAQVVDLSTAVARDVADAFPEALAELNPQAPTDPGRSDEEKNALLDALHSLGIGPGSGRPQQRSQEREAPATTVEEEPPAREGSPEPEEEAEAEDTALLEYTAALEVEVARLRAEVARLEDELDDELFD